MRTLLRSIFCRKAFAISAFLLAAIATVYVAVRTFERWRAERAWSAYVAEATARGTKLWAADYIAAPIPPAENFAAIPLFEDCFRKDPAPRPLEHKGKRPKVGEAGSGQRTSMAEWQDYFVREKMLDAPDTEPARGVLAALTRFAAPLEQIAQAARRPHCVFPVRWEQGFAATMPHLSTIQDATRLFALRANAHLAAKDSAAALTDVQTLFAIYRALRREPVLISGLIRVSIISTAESVIAEGLADDAWSNDALRTVQRELTETRLLDDLAFSLASERAIMNTTIAPLAQKPTRELASLMTIISGPMPPSPPPGVVFAWSLYPRGWLIQSQLKMNQMFDDAIARIDSTAGRMRTLERDPTEELLRSSIPRRFYNLLAALAMPAVLSVEKRYVFAQARAQQTLAACALELFRRATGQYPERLEELIPQFATALPVDPVDGAPQRYRRAESGGYLLWSIGTNGVDDGGKTVEKKPAQDQPDWVWRR